MPSLDDFGRHFWDRRPIVVRGGAAQWRACTPWNAANLAAATAADPSLEVPVEVGGDYLDPRMERLEMPLGAYLTYLEGLGDDEAPPREQLAYAAQAMLPASLAADVEPPAFCGAFTGRPARGQAGAARGEVYAIMGWVGPKGTVTPLHRDPYHNCFAQVTGRKRVRLFHPAHEPALYPIASDGPTRLNSSPIDAESPDLARFPTFANAVGPTVDLGPGDLLYVPKRWWHHVRSLSKSVSVSVWWL
jgi:lysine-specific demethylase 8